MMELDSREHPNLRERPSWSYRHKLLSWPDYKISKSTPCKVTDGGECLMPAALIGQSNLAAYLRSASKLLPADEHELNLTGRPKHRTLFIVAQRISRPGETRWAVFFALVGEVGDRTLACRRLLLAPTHPSTERFCDRARFDPDAPPIFPSADAAGERCMIADCLKRLSTSPSTVTRMALPLEKLGLVDREADARDARLAYVVLTESGRVLVGNARTTLERLSVEVFRDRWTKQEIGSLAELLSRITAGQPGDLSN